MSGAYESLTATRFDMSEAKAPRPKKPNVKQPWVDAVVFALEECVRFQGMFQDAVQRKEMAGLPKNDLLYELRGSEGLKLICGRAAIQRLREVCADCLRRAKRADSISVDRMLKALKSIVVDRFVTQDIEPSLQSVEKAFAAALRQCVKACGDSRHLIPCQLMFVADPDKFEIGPVTFHNRQAFKPIGEALVADNVRAAAEKGHAATSDEVLAYYGSFSWVGDVTIRGCDQGIAEDRANLAVTAALDFLHLLFGHYHSRKMVVGGPGLDSDRRGTIEVRDGATTFSYSVGATSAVGFEEGWADMMQDFGSRQWVGSAGRALEAITDPAVRRPLGLRMVDAAAWHGQAVRESSAAAAIVKSVSALERLVATEDSADITQIISERSAAIRYNPAIATEFETLLAEMRSIYDLRSRLVHGSLSPFDPEVRSCRAAVLDAVESVLVNGLVLFDQDSLFDRDLGRRDLKAGLEQLVAWARRIDGEKRTKLMTPPGA